MCSARDFDQLWLGKLVRTAMRLDMSRKTLDQTRWSAIHHQYNQRWGRYNSFEIEANTDLLPVHLRLQKQFREIHLRGKTVRFLANVANMANNLSTESHLVISFATFVIWIQDQPTRSEMLLSVQQPYRLGWCWTLNEVNTKLSDQNIGETQPELRLRELRKLTEYFRC